jgi:hypothetical protein
METPDYLEEHFPPQITARRGINLTRIFFDKFRFSSAIEPGLEMADILANAIRRALVGHLQPSGWLNFAAMMIPRKGFQLMTLGKGGSANTLPYKRVAVRFHHGGRNMFTPNHRRSTPEG